MRGFGAAAWAAGAIGLVLVGCSGDLLARLRGTTYPPEFHYITRSEIRTTMGMLAREMVVLERLLLQSDGSSAEERAAVVEVLARMEPLAMSLKRGERSNHPKLDEYAPLLQHNVTRALDGARKDPPNYYYAGVLSGSCNFCHGSPLTAQKLAP